MNKKDTRNKIKALKQQLTTSQIEDSSESILKAFMKQTRIDDYDAIYTYVAFNEEIQTKALMEYAFSMNKKIAVPKIIEKEIIEKEIAEKEIVEKEIVEKENLENDIIDKKIITKKFTEKKMEFYYINQLDDLKTGFYGILEPITNQIAMDQNILMIMPGLAFDELCNRIGYGAGYYDIYLKEKESLTIHKIALAYDFQILEQIEVNEYDIKVDQIITPTRCIKGKRD